MPLPSLSQLRNTLPGALKPAVVSPAHLYSGSLLKERVARGIAQFQESVPPALALPLGAITGLLPALLQTYSDERIAHELEYFELLLRSWRMGGAPPVLDQQETGREGTQEEAQEVTGDDGGAEAQEMVEEARTDRPVAPEAEESASAGGLADSGS